MKFRQKKVLKTDVTLTIWSSVFEKDVGLQEKSDFPTPLETETHLKLISYWALIINMLFLSNVSDHPEGRLRWGGWASGQAISQLWEEEKLQVWHCASVVLWRTGWQVSILVSYRVTSKYPTELWTFTYRYKYIPHLYLLLRWKSLWI